MKIAVVSYSLTGNNEALAQSIAAEFGAEHVKVTEQKPRTMGTIIADLIFRRTPQVQPAPAKLDHFDLILFSGPVWIGQVATPLRAYFKHLKSHRRRYAFISINGGADGPNTKIADELEQRAGAKPVALLDLHIADLLPPDPQPTRKMTSAYRVNASDVGKLTAAVVKVIQPVPLL